MPTNQSTRPTDLPAQSRISANWHSPVNEHPWLTHADIIDALSRMYCPENADHCERLAVEAETVGAMYVVNDLREYAAIARNF